MKRGIYRLCVSWFSVGLVYLGANMAGRPDKNAYKFVLELLILSQKQILSVMECYLIISIPDLCTLPYFKYVVWGSF